MVGYLRLVTLIVVLALFTLAMAPVQLMAIKFNLKFAKHLPKYWHKVAVWFAGVNVKVNGSIPKTRPLLIVSNHISWMDIPVLGSITDLAFIAKREIGEMPGANFLSYLQRTILVTRENQREAGKQAQAITNRLLNNEAIVLFAEGTTRDGTLIGEFKSSLFGAAQYALASHLMEKIYIQPVSIAYTKCHGIRMGRNLRKEVAWVGDQSLFPHAKKVLLKSGYDVEVTFGEMIEVDGFAKRRELASQTHAQVYTMFMKSLHNRKTV